MSDAILWVAGNLVLPLLPVLISTLTLKAAGRELGVHEVLEDGVLFFYTATVAAVFLLDLYRVGFRDAPELRAVGFAAGVVVLLVATCCYSIAAWGRAGARAIDGQPARLAWLSELSWQLTGIALISSLSARFALNLF